MLADDLTKAQVCERDGILYAVGLSGGFAYIEWSDDTGATKGTYADGSTARLISPERTGDEQPAIEALQTGELIVALTQNGAVKTYVSRDEGESWWAVG